MTNIYLISMKKSTDRRKNIKKRFPEFHKKFKIIDALDANNINPKKIPQAYKKYFTNNHKSDLTLGEKCCAISHLKALESLLETGDKSCIIIEDDIIGNDIDFKKAINIAKESPENSLIILGGQQGLKNSRYLSGFKDNHKELLKIPRFSQFFISRACCYVATRQAAKSIINSQRISLKRSDDWMFFCKKNIKLLYADIFLHPTDLKNSTLEKERQGKTIIKKIKNDGIKTLISRNICKVLIKILTSTKLLEKAEIKQLPKIAQTLPFD